MRIAVVTGHSRGLGAAIAEQLLDRGVGVVGVSRRPNGQLAAKFAQSLREHQLDLGDMAAVGRWLEAGGLADSVGRAAEPMLVNNAGLLRPIGPLDTQPPLDAAQAVTVNVAAALALSAAFVQATTAARDRRMLHVSSGAGRKAYAGWSVYCATKAALDHHARCIALDRTPNLRICSVAPGVVDTDMQAEIRASTNARFPDRERFVAMKREGTLHAPEDTARLLVDHLLSPAFGEEAIFDLRAR